MAANPRKSYGTRTAMLRLSRCIGSAFRAMLREGRTRRQLSTVDFFMARDANRFSIVNGKAEVGKFRPRFNVMGLNHLPMIAATLTAELISFEYLLAPFRYLRLVDFSFGGGCPALPVPMPLTAFRLIVASWGAKLLTQIAAKKRQSALLARPWLQWCANIPTRLRAVFCIGSVLFSFKSLSAYHARPVYAMPSVFTPDRIKAFCRAIDLRSKTRLIILPANRAHGGLDFLDSKVVAPEKKWRVELTSFAFGCYGRSAAALTYIHGQIISGYLLSVKHCFVIYQRMSTPFYILQRMTDAFPGIEIRRIE